VNERGGEIPLCHSTLFSDSMIYDYMALYHHSPKIIVILVFHVSILSLIE